MIRDELTTRGVYPIWLGLRRLKRDTVDYLAYDPADVLSSRLPARMLRASTQACHASFCVYAVHRLAKNWYTVQFYTDTDWTHCD